MKKFTLVLVAFLVALVSTTFDLQGQAATKKTIKIEHQLGDITLNGPAKRIIAFDFGALDTLDELGLEKNIVGVPRTLMPDYLKKKYDTDKYANVGALNEPNYEKVSALKPDLIIISARLSDKYKEFSKIAPTLYIQTNSNEFARSYYNAFISNTELIGKAVGKEKEVKKALEKIKAVRTKTATKIEKENINGLFLMVSGGKLSAYGPKSRFGLVHDVLKVKPSDKAIKPATHGQKVSFEYVAEHNPQYLFVIDRDAAIEQNGTAAKRVLDNDLIKTTTAYKKNQIVYLHGDVWYLSGGGLQSFKMMMEELAKAIK